MKVTAFGKTDVGQRREKNEDSFLINDNYQLYVVADGMGGHLGGEIASQLAAKTIESVMIELDADPDMTLQEDSSVDIGDYGSHLSYAISQACLEVFDRAANDHALKGMGTTSVVLFIRDDNAYIANVGDSRVYRIRNNSITQITKDHSLVGEQLRAGMITEEDAKKHKFKNIITRSVGFQEHVDAEIDVCDLQSNDFFILCSDGLCNMISNDEILDIVCGNKMSDVCGRLVDVANERGGDDNITVVVVNVESMDNNDFSEEPTIESSESD